jgi:hypothetical protein
MLTRHDRALSIVVSLLLLALAYAPAPLPTAAQPTVDGNVTDSQYLTIGTRETSNNSFGDARDVGDIVYYADDNNSMLYIGVKGELPTSGIADGIALWLEFDDLNGRPRGNSLGVSGASEYMDGDGNGGNTDFKADMEVDYMFALNSGGGSSNVFVDGVDFASSGGPYSGSLGQTDQNGTSTTNDGNLFGGGTVEFAFDNSGYSNSGGSQNTGFEIAIPYAQLGDNGVSTVGGMEVFGSVVDPDALFSGETVPGDVANGNSDIGTAPRPGC